MKSDLFSWHLPEGPWSTSPHCGDAFPEAGLVGLGRSGEVAVRRSLHSMCDVSWVGTPHQVAGLEVVPLLPAGVSSILELVADSTHDSVSTVHQ